MTLERNINYDLMRLIGVLIIMIAHASPPDWLFQLRNFGTPLLIVGSALTYALIYESRSLDVWKFYRRRLSRLVLPAWIFLSFFFLSFYVSSALTGENYPFSIRKIIGSYTFASGIGFVWVLKVYIILALITPFAVRFNRRISSPLSYFSLLAAGYVLYELSYLISEPYMRGAIARIMETVVFIVVPYSLLYLYGFRLAKLNPKYVAGVALISFLIFVGLFISKYMETGSPVPVQDYKYPPTLYYLSYAFFALNIVYLLCSRIRLEGQRLKAVIIWLSSNSLWIYLWHIMAFYIWKQTMPDPDGDAVLFLLKVTFLLGFGVVSTMLQNTLVALIFTDDKSEKSRIAPLLSGNA
ncbi:MAG: acyltransferase [Cellvibrionaceae bacterium]|nr:acyltransferase [Cellvibrionaceae bacterium]